MRKLLAIDFKRLLQNKASIIFTVAVPLVLVVLVSLLLAPYFFSNAIVEEYYVVIFNEDDHPLTTSLLDTILDNNEFDKLLGAVFVDSEQEAYEELKNGAAAYVHLPPNMQDAISKDEPVVITYIGNPNMPLEDALLTEAMNAASDLVNFTQNAASVIYDNVSQIDESKALDIYSAVSKKYFFEVMNRKAIYTKQADDVSPYGSIVPIEYYASALLILFIALGGMPIAKSISDDVTDGLIHRQLLSGNPPLRILLSKWLSGSVFLLIQFIVLSAALMIVTKNMSYYAGSFLSLLSCGVLLCIFVSVLQICIGLYFKNSEIVSFITILLLGFAGGLFVPPAFMPSVLRSISVYTPLSLAHKLAVSGMFRIQASGLIATAAILVGFCAVLIFISTRRMVRRTI